MFEVIKLYTKSIFDKFLTRYKFWQKFWNIFECNQICVYFEALKYEYIKLWQIKVSVVWNIKQEGVIGPFCCELFSDH